MISALVPGARGQGSRPRALCCVLGWNRSVNGYRPIVGET